jgi:hypothetical protein
MEEDETTNHCVEWPGGSQLGDLGLPEFEPSAPDQLGPLTRPLKGTGRPVDSDHPARLADDMRSYERDVPDTAADVEDGHPRGKSRTTKQAIGLLRKQSALALKTGQLLK